MASVAHLNPEPAPVVACTVCRDVQNFDLLIEDMEAELGERWGDLSYEDALVFLDQPDARALEFFAVAVDADDEDEMALIAQVIEKARDQGVKVILVADQLSPAALHQLLRLGAEDFVPYPLPEGALHDAIARLRAPAPAPVAASVAPVASEPPPPAAAFKATGGKEGVILPVHGLGGGVGATTFAVNLAWELASVTKTNPPRVLLMDLDLQFGAVATSLDLPRRESTFELLSDVASIDVDAFQQSVQSFNDRLYVFTSPNDMLPLDFISGEDVQKLLALAAANYDYVVIDMPKTVVQWTETVLSSAHVYFALMELDMRCAQNTQRLLRALKSESLPYEKLRFALNRAPGFTDLSGKSRVKRLAESLAIDIEVLLPDGGKPVTQSNDHGLPLAENAGKNPLRKEIQKLAKSVHDLNQAVETGKK